MSAFIRLLEAATVLRPVVQNVALRQALPYVIKLTAIAITTSVIAAAVIVLAFYGLHLEMVIHGYGQEQALLLTFCIASATLILFVLLILIVAVY